MRGPNLSERRFSERTLALLIQRTLEEHLYFIAATLRFSQEDSFAHVAEVFKTVLPPLLGGLIVKLIRKDMLKSMRDHGMFELPQATMIEFARADLTAISEILGEKPFFLGERPSSIDATAYGFLIQLLWVPWESPLTKHVQGLGNLNLFCERMKRKYWS